MLPVLETIGLGILSGVLTSGILFVVYQLVLYVFNPWLENRLYKGIVLEGSWKGERRAFESIPAKDGAAATQALSHLVEIKMELKQKGYRVEGIFSAYSKSYDKGRLFSEYNNLYNIKGHIAGSHLVLEYFPLSRKRAGLGTFLFEVMRGGKEMRGSVVFLEESKMVIRTWDDLRLKRSSEI